MYQSSPKNASSQRRWFRATSALASMLILCLTSGTALAAVLEPVADGTISDGRNGPYDGIPDAWDWSFNDTSYEGSITLLDDQSNSIEDRLVWEFDLRGISLLTPFSATLTFTLRGPPVFPRPETAVHIYSYVADLVEDETDYDAPPQRLIATIPIVAFQPRTTYVVDVSRDVNDMLSNGAIAAGFRFQIDPNTPHAINQVFIDALDTSPTTKPMLTVDANLLGDSDGDQDVDLSDFSEFTACMQGPTVSTVIKCRAFDFDFDGDVDMADSATFQLYATLYPTPL